MQKNINIEEIKIKLIELYKEKFKLNMEKSTNVQFKKNHILKNLKYKIAKLLTKINMTKEKYKNEIKR